MPFLKTGDVIGGVVLEQCIEVGGQGAVFRSRYQGEPVAVKVLTPRGPAEEAKARERFEREQDLLMQLHHPNLVEVRAAGTQKIRHEDQVHSVPYIIMELMAGPAMRAHDEAVEWRRVVEIARDAARGLAELHAHRLVHRDIKPGNILVASDGTAKLSDLGMAGFLDLSSSGGMTLAYASPEQLGLVGLLAPEDLPTKHADELSDIYSLGISLYHMLAGGLPFDMHGMQIASMMGCFRLPVLDVDAPAELLDLVVRMAAFRRDQRPGSVTKVLEVLERLARRSAPVEIRQVDHSQEEATLRRYAQAFLRPGFFDAISRLKGTRLGGWEVLSLYAVGGEGVLARVRKGQRAGLLKMPNLPYDRPASFGSAQIRARRTDLDLEAAMLKRFSGSLLPTLLELAEGPNPLLTDRSEGIAKGEKYLVMEFIPGRAVDLEIRDRSRRAGSEALRWLLERLVFAVLRFAGRLKAEGASFFYTDFKPSNILVAPDDSIALLDGGSIVSVGAAKGAPVTEGYCPLALARAARSQSELERISLLALGRTLYAALSNHVLYEGVELELQGLEKLCGPAWASWIERACQGGFATLGEADAARPRSRP